MRLEAFDYRTPGAYFVTICTEDRRQVFGRVNIEEMLLSLQGRVAQECWAAIPQHSRGVELDAFVVMPNHLHGIIFICDPLLTEREAQCIAQPQPQGMRLSPNLGYVIRTFKAAVTRQLVKLGTPMPVWQSDFYDRVIRDDRELNEIRRYITDNPKQWQGDPHNSEEAGLKRGGERNVLRSHDPGTTRNLEPDAPASRLPH